MSSYNNIPPCSSPTSSRITLDNISIPRLPPPASAPVRAHQRSRTTVDLPLFSRTPSASPTRSSTFLPFIGSSSRSTSPKRVSPGEAAEFDLDSNGNDRLDSSSKQAKTSGRVRGLTSWFEGASEPVNIGLVASPKEESPEPFYEAEASSEHSSTGSTDSMDSFTKRPQMKRPAASPAASTSRFSFFRKASTPHMRPDTDDLVNVDLRDSLFPEGMPDECTPASYKNLQLNAEAMLRKFQTAYKENLAALRKVTSDTNIQADELEASNTRNEHLKMQLLEMAERAAEQEKTIASLRAEAEEQKNVHSIRMVGDDFSEQDRDLPRRHRVRNSDVSGYADSFDSSDNSEPHSSAVSIFSDVAESIRSPATSVGCPSPTLKHVTRVVSPNIVHLQNNPSLSPSPVMESCARPQHTQVMVPECQKCHGVKPNEAWDVIGIMKMESAALKGRIAELEVANEGALDILTLLNLNA